jgi:transcription-repair coupling factor (superfamily II helicase)
MEARSLDETLRALEGRGRAAERPWRVFGLRGGARAYFVARFLAVSPRPSVVVAATAAEAESWLADLRFFLGEDEDRPALDRRVHGFPPWDTEPLSGVSPTAEVVAERLATLYSLSQMKAPVVVASADALLQKLPPRETVIDTTRYCVEGEEAGFASVVDGLAKLRVTHVVIPFSTPLV